MPQSMTTLADNADVITDFFTAVSHYQQLVSYNTHTHNTNEHTASTG